MSRPNNCGRKATLAMRAVLACDARFFHVPDAHARSIKRESLFFMEAVNPNGGASHRDIDAS
jgi:hypothetical protein